MLSKKRWTIFSLLVLCGGTIYKLPSLKDAFYVPMQEYFHLTNGEIGKCDNGIDNPSPGFKEAKQAPLLSVVPQHAHRL